MGSTRCFAIRKTSNASIDYSNPRVSYHFQAQALHAEVLQAAVLRVPRPQPHGVQVERPARPARLLGGPQGLRGHAGDQPLAAQVPDQARGALRRRHDRNVAAVRLGEFLQPQKIDDDFLRIALFCAKVHALFCALAPAQFEAK